MQSVVVYIGLFFVVLLLARMAELTNKRKYIVFIVAVFSLIAGLRAETVGLDTRGYINSINNIINGRLTLAYGLEWSFRYICQLLSYFIKEPQVYLLLFASITNTLVILRLWELKEHISFSWAVFAYYSMFYMASLNLTRQFIAIAIVFYATKYLMQGENIKFLIWLLVASLFHLTALLGIVYLYFNIVNWKQLSRRHKRFLIAAVFLLPIMFLHVYKNLVQYSGYLDLRTYNVGFMIIVKLIIVAVSSWMLDRTETPDIEDSAKIIRFSRCTLIVGLLLTALGYIFRFVDRIGLYFYVFEAVYMGYIFKQKNTKSNFMIKIVVSLLFIYIFLGNTLGNGQGQAPYLFYWQ